MELFNNKPVVRMYVEEGMPMCTECVCNSSSDHGHSVCLAPDDLVCWEQDEDGHTITDSDCYFVYE